MLTYIRKHLNSSLSCVCLNYSCSGTGFVHTLQREGEDFLLSQPTALGKRERKHITVALAFAITTSCPFSFTVSLSNHATHIILKTAFMTIPNTNGLWCCLKKVVAQTFFIHDKGNLSQLHLLKRQRCDLQQPKEATRKQTFIRNGLLWTALCAHPPAKEIQSRRIRNGSYLSFQSLSGLCEGFMERICMFLLQILAGHQKNCRTFHPCTWIHTVYSSWQWPLGFSVGGPLFHLMQRWELSFNPRTNFDF